MNIYCKIVTYMSVKCADLIFKMYILNLLVILLILMNIEAERRIFEGEEVSSTKNMPFIVKLQVYYSDKEGKEFVSGCGGSYIRPLWVITAAHCFMDQFPIVNNKPTHDVDMLMGTAEFAKTPKKDIRRAKEVHLHTPGDPAFNEHDVALVSVAKPWVLGPTIQLAKLPTKKVDKKIYHNMACMIGGWGVTTIGGVDNPVLKQAHVTVIVGDRQKCPVEDVVSRGNRQLCAMGGTGMACHGDSGGPLICQGVVIGVCRAITGRHGAKPFCNSSTEVTVFYNMIQEYNDWIASIAGDVSGIVPNNLCLSVIYVTLYFFYMLN